MRGERLPSCRDVWGVPLGIAVAVALLACGAGGGADGADGDRADATPAAAESAAGEIGQEAGAAEGQEAGEEPAPVDAMDPGTVRITVGGHPVTVEVADDDAERQRGLMHRDSLPEDHGMLFVYESERLLSFWMRNTRIPLDVAFIDRSGRIVDIQQMEAMSDVTHTSKAPALYALEMSLGWFDEHGVEVGETVEF